jgi:hypothetical protein
VVVIASNTATATATSADLVRVFDATLCSSECSKYAGTSELSESARVPRGVVQELGRYQPAAFRSFLAQPGRRSAALGRKVGVLTNFTQPERGNPQV